MKQMEIIEHVNYNCKICNKKYKTYQTLWKHNKNCHPVKIDENENKNDNKDDNKIKCKYCSRAFNFRNNKWKHEKVCKHKEQQNIIDENKQKELDLEFKKEELRIKKENIKQLKEETKILQLKIKLVLELEKIKLLQDTYLKKHKHTNYPEKNVIYMLTTEDNKKKRNYVIGKAINLTNCLSSYNKTAKHEVVYFKECKNEEDMNTIELMVLNKLKNYKEKADRDRFILPLEKDISFFTNVIDECVKFL